MLCISVNRARLTPFRGLGANPRCTAFDLTAARQCLSTAPKWEQDKDNSQRVAKNSLRGLRTYIEKQKAGGGLIHRHHFMVRQTGKLQTILALFSRGRRRGLFNDFKLDLINLISLGYVAKRNGTNTPPKN